MLLSKNVLLNLPGIRRLRRQRRLLMIAIAAVLAVGAFRKMVKISGSVEGLSSTGNEQLNMGVLTGTGRLKWIALKIGTVLAYSKTVGGRT